MTSPKDGPIMQVNQWYTTTHPNGGTYTINLCGYYNELANKKLINIVKILEVANKFNLPKKHALYEYLDSVRSRYEAILFQTDQIKQIHAVVVDNDSQFLIELLSFDVICAMRTISESLAWTIRHWYDMTVAPENVTLEIIGKNGKQRPFKNALDLLDIELANIIAEKSLQTWLVYITSYRDIIQHRHRVRIMRTNNGGVEHIGIALDPELFLMKDAHDEDGFTAKMEEVTAKYGDVIENIDSWMNRQIDTLTQLINSVINHLLRQG